MFHMFYQDSWSAYQFTGIFIQLNKIISNVKSKLHVKIKYETWRVKFMNGLDYLNMQPN